MTKKHFVALANEIRQINLDPSSDEELYFTDKQLNILADFCQAQNPQFDRERWLNYIAGTHTAHGRKLS